jgi:hypothetical protein
VISVEAVLRIASVGSVLACLAVHIAVSRTKAAPVPV